MSFGTDVRDLAATLTNMHKTAIERCNFDQNEAKQKMREYLAYDGRFRDYDHEALINRVAECRSNGAILDFDDPRLKGQAPRRWNARTGDPRQTQDCVAKHMRRLTSHRQP